MREMGLVSSHHAILLNSCSRHFIFERRIYLFMEF